MKKLALTLLSFSLLIGACQQRPTAETTPAASPVATTPATPSTPIATAPATPSTPAGDLTAFAGEYTGNYSDKKKEDQKTKGLTETATNLTLNADGSFTMTVSVTGTDPETKEEKSEEFSVQGTFAVEDKNMKLTAKTLTATDGKETPAPDDKPLVMTIEEDGKKLTVSPDQATDSISPDFFQKN